MPPGSVRRTATLGPGRGRLQETEPSRYATKGRPTRLDGSMHHPRSAAAAFLLALIASLTVAVGGDSPASAAVGPNTTWMMRGDPGDPLLGQQTYSYDASSGIEFAGTASLIEGRVEGWTLYAGAQAGGVLQAGQTYSGTVGGSPTATEPSLSLTNPGRSCNSSAGNFTIHEITFDPAGQVESVVLTFQHYCVGKKGPAQGSIAWHASRPAPALAPIVPQLRLKVTPTGRRPFPYGTVVTAVTTCTATPRTASSRSTCVSTGGPSDSWRRALPMPPACSRSPSPSRRHRRSSCVWTVRAWTRTSRRRTS